jgi:capsular polysaccharide biosynthesis protein
MTTFEDEKTISIRDIFRTIRRYIWLILIMIVVTSGIALGYTFFQTPQYEASVKILVGQESGFVGASGNVQQLEDLTQTMSQAVITRPVAEEVIRQQGLNLTPEALLGRLSANQIPQTQFIQVNYRDTDPRTARSMADAVGYVFTEQVSEVSPDYSAVTATVWEQAAVPGQPANVSYRRNITVGLMVGAILGVGLAFLLEYLANTKKKGERWDNES